MPRPRRVPAPEWAAVSVDYFDDPDIAALTPSVREAHLRLILATVRHLTDGEITPLVAKWASVTPRQIASLQEAGLIVAGRLKGWDNWQKPRDEWIATLESKRHAGRVRACRRYHEDWCRCLDGHPPIPRNGVAPATASGTADGTADGIEQVTRNK